MGIIENFKQRRNNISELIDKVDKVIEETNIDIGSKRGEFISMEHVSELIYKCQLPIGEIEEFIRKSIIPNKKLVEAGKKLAAYMGSLEHTVQVHNSNTASLFRDNGRQLIGDVEGRQLDDQQMDCIVKPAHNHLVIAGAGTGKTTTIVGKLKYLLATKACGPDDILVLSYTNASAAEMKQRIEKETGCSIQASTFHKLGLNILTSVQGLVPKITKINLSKFVKDRITELANDPGYMSMLCDYVLGNHKYNRDEFSFSTKEEYDEYLRLNPPITLNQEEVKSYGEMKIANFLFINGIKYTYEKEYSKDTRTSEHAQYYPDFFLSDYGIYIEYFGIDRQGNAPAYFSPSGNAKEATTRYVEGMEWKRKLHKEQSTKLIEFYAYENMEGILEQSLNDKLKEAGIEFHPLTPQEVWDKVAESSNDALTAVTELFSTLIALIKDTNIGFEGFREKYLALPIKTRSKTLLLLIEPVFNAYRDELVKNDEIDFSDMINTAAKYVAEGKYINSFSHVIVDEYQDISKSRFKLLETLRKSHDYSLFCVGDDWQSIYRFAGSDVNYIIRFSDFWGPSERSRIETTYRYSNTLAQISGEFIMRNPFQIRKALKGKMDESGFPVGEIMGYTDKTATGHMLERLDELPKESTVFFIGRYNFESRMLDDCPELTCQYDNAKSYVNVSYSKRPDLKMVFITAHRSKGLQADYVFIINNKRSGMGFPSTIQDDPAVDILLEGSDDYPFAEERRLFYVALTRAKKKVYLLVLKDKESVFAEEIISRYGDAMRRDLFSCPVCGAPLVKKSGKFGEFYGCTNYAKTGCNYKRPITPKPAPQESAPKGTVQISSGSSTAGNAAGNATGNTGVLCPLCGGKTVIRTVKTGARAGAQFIGCTNYPRCKYTKNI